MPEVLEKLGSSRACDTYLQATTMTFPGIVACQIGTALAARTDHVSLVKIACSPTGCCIGILFELTVTAAVVCLPVAHDLLGTRSLGLSELGVLCSPSSCGVPTSCSGQSGGASPSKKIPGTPLAYPCLCPARSAKGTVGQ